MSDTSALLGAVCPNWFCRSSDSPAVHAFPNVAGSVADECGRFFERAHGCGTVRDSYPIPF